MKEKVKVSLLRSLERMLKKEVEIQVNEWPPRCVGLLHQPERPKSDKQ